jgi:hypothetical protein
LTKTIAPYRCLKQLRRLFSEYSVYSDINSFTASHNAQRERINTEKSRAIDIIFITVVFAFSVLIDFTDTAEIWTANWVPK